MNEKDDLHSVWEQDGDLELMKAFFYSIDATEVQKERIKERVLEKISQLPVKDEEMLSTVEEGTLSLWDRIKSLKWHWKWQMALPLAGIVLLLFFTQELLNQPNLPLDRMAKQQDLTVASSETEDGGALNNQLQKEMAPESPASANFTTDNRDMKSAASDTGSGQSGSAGQGKAGSQSVDANAAALPATAIPAPSFSGAEDTLVTGSLPPLKGVAPQADLAGKVVCTYSLAMDVSKGDKAVQGIIAKAESVGGFLAEPVHSLAKDVSYLTLKVPAAQYETFRSGLNALGKVSGEIPSLQNITEEYYQVVIEQSQLDKAQESYQSSMAQSQDTTEKQALGTELSEVEKRKEDNKAKIENWENSVYYATVTITIKSQ